MEGHNEGMCTMGELSWKARRRGALYCAPACGGGCTRAAYERAVSESKKLAKHLGKGWRPEVWENLGWHWKVISPCRRWRVSPNVYRRKIESYSAALGQADSPGARWIAHGKTPESAIRNARRAARSEVAALSALLETAATA